MSSTKTNVNKKAMIEALEKTLGVVTHACEKVGISRNTHYQWLKDDADYKEKVEDIDAVAIDFVESSLFKQIKDGNTTATIFFLKTRGKKRGYSQKYEPKEEKEERPRLKAVKNF